MASELDLESFSPDAVTGEEREELRGRIAELNAVYRLADAVAHAESLDDVLDEAVAALLEAVGSDRAAVLLADDEGVVRFRAWRGLSDEYRAAAEGHSPWAPDERDPQPVVVPDVETAELAPALKQTIRREGIRALAFVPLVHQGRLVGTFMLYRDEPYEFRDDELLLCRTVASHLASSTVQTQVQTALRESRNQLAVILRSVADGITVVRADGALLFANEAAAQMTGFDTPEAMLAATSEERLGAFELYDEDRRPLPLAELPSRRALEGGEAERIICWRIRATGAERWSIVRSSPVFDASGNVELAVNVFHDITERKRVEERRSFLAEASDALAASLDYEETLRNLASLAVPRFADWCVVTVVEDDGFIRPVALSHADPEKTADAEEFARRSPPDPDSPVGVAAVIRSGEAELIPELPEELLDAASEGQPELRRRLKEIAPRSAMTVPLTSRGRTLGAISFLAAESGRRYDADDLAVAEDLARRAAAAVDNALLYRDAEDAGVRARESLALVDSLFQSAPVGLAFWDRELRYERVNSALLAMYGLSAEEILGRHVFDVFPAFEQQIGGPLRRALDHGEPTLDVEVVGETPAQPGVTRYLRASFYPVRDEAERVLGVGSVVHEVTAERRAQAEAEAARRRIEFLSVASQALATTLDYRETLAQVAALAVPRICESCNVFVAEGDGERLVRVAQAHVDPELEELLGSLDPVYDVERDAAVPVVRVFRTAEPLHLPRIDAPPAGAARSQAERAAAERLGTHSLIALPLVVRGRTLGVATFASRQPGRHGSEDFELAAELARRVAVALDHASLYRDAQESLAQLRAVLDQLPIGVLIADARGRLVLGNAAIEEIWRMPLVTGSAIEGRPRFRAWHADGREVELETWPIVRSLEQDEVVIGERLSIIRGDGTPGTVETSSVPVRDEAGRLVAAVALTADVTERLRQDTRVRFLASAGDLLNASLDVEETLASIAALAVPGLAGQCIVDLVEGDGSLRCVATAHVDPVCAELLREMRRTYPPVVPAHPVQRALATGEPQFLPELDAASIDAMAHDARHAELIRTLGNTSGIVVPLIARGRTLGAITLGTVPPQPPFEAADVEFAADLARRAATAVENAMLYRAAESQAHAAQALAFIDDGVFLADETEVVRLWNPAAAAITGVDAEAAVGRPVGDSLPGWEALRQRIPVAPYPQPGGSRASTLPLEVGDRERWIAISGVRFHGGTVYAFRDVTEERAVERLKSDFVSTVSHELRTPLAAIYGAALTLRRIDVRLEETQRAGLLEVIANEADRLARIVNDILWASRLDSGSITIAIESCDGGALARQVFDATAQYAPAGIVLALAVPEDLPPVAADPDKIRQVLTNLLDNAVKYSPDGGRVELAAEQRDDRLRFRVSDEGLGIPPGEHERIFEKFYRLDPNLTRGVGGTGLGLYISRELVHRMHGGIWVESDGRNGSTFLVELPLAEG